ncbi:unnamed protein product [Notodromas monacha]|uniref:Kinetochore protein NDC80 n=1 Tax=Notodromas monacha TaxID=399045 RepID=A0A7R9GCW8_9CRUS|nr:unnamed protein product [Notodromas monacha]CAG0916379.1 unnamed protein product [Notodromas monacha]
MYRQRSASTDNNKRSLIPQLNRRRSRSNEGSDRKKSVAAMPMRNSVCPPNALRNLKASRPTGVCATPLSASSRSTRYTMSATKSPGSAFSNRPTNDPSYPAAVSDRIDMYFLNEGHDYRVPREFRTSQASKQQFLEVFVVLAQRLDPNFAPGGVKVSEDDILRILRMLGYSATLPKSSLVVLQKRSWPQVIATIDFLLETISQLDSVEEDHMSLIFRNTGDPVAEDAQAFQSAVLAEVINPDYCEFVSAAHGSEEEDINRIKERAQVAIEKFYNIDDVDPEQIEKESCELERQLEAQNELFHVACERYKQTSASVEEMVTSRDECEEKILNIAAQIESLCETNDGVKSRLDNISSKLAHSQEVNAKLRLQIANQPMSYMAAEELRGDRKNLKLKINSLEKSLDHMRSLREGKKAELAALRSSFDSQARTFNSENLLRFGTKGIKEFGANSASLDQASIVEWSRTVGKNLKSTAQSAHAEKQSLALSIDALKTEIASQEKQLSVAKTELTIDLSNATNMKQSQQTMREQWKANIRKATDDFLAAKNAAASLRIESCELCAQIEKLVIASQKMNVKRAEAVTFIEQLSGVIEQRKRERKEFSAHLLQRIKENVQRGFADMAEEMTMLTEGSKQSYGLY